MHKTQTTDDIGIAANNSNEVTDCSQNRSKSPFIQFFVSFWARVKFLFTTTLAEACDCSSHSKGKSSYGDSCSVKGEDDIEVCVDLLDSAYVFNPTVATVFDQEPLELLKTAQPTKDVGVQRCEEVVDKPVVEAAVCTLLRESSHRLENFYTTLDDTDATEPIAEMHLEPVEQSNVSRFSNAVAFAQPIMLASLKPQAHFPELLLVVEKSNFFDFPTVFEEDEGEFGLENDFPGESLCSSLEIPNNSGNIHPVTVLGRLHSKLRNGDITTAEYNTRADSLIASTIPRNLSDSEVTRKPHGANQLYAWQLPPPLPESTGDEVTPPRDKQVTDVSDTSTFIDSVISDAVMEVSDSFDKEKKHIPPFLNLIDRSSRAEEDSFYLNLPCPADVSYDGLQTASLGRIRNIYWDNNHGENYQIHCYAKATDIAGDGSWIHYL
uniref:CBM21 domain-containing protein n=1 Tax=Mesocestoides corti TaxID=53468 RepID=A0A5K3F0S5_MESCO